MGPRFRGDDVEGLRIRTTRWFNKGLFNPHQFIECECATLCVVPAKAGTHKHRSVFERKPLAIVPKREAAPYGSPRSRGRR